MVAYAAGFGALSILRHEAFATGRFDLGNMTQAVWATAHGHPLAVTSLEGEQFVRLGAHADPILVLLAPLWWLWPSPSMLLAVQAVLLALGALPVFWLARKHLASDWAALGLALAFLLLPALQWMTLSEFHPVALATPLLLFALWYLDEERLAPFLACAFLAIATKEHVGLAIAGLGVWYALSRRRLLPGLAIALAGIAVAAVTVGVVIPSFRPEGAAAFASRYDEVGGSPLGVLRTAVSEPGVLLGQAFDGRTFGYLAALVLPLAGLCLAAPLVLVAALPELALNVLSATPTQTSIHFHYAATVLPALAGAAVFGTARLARGLPRRAERLALLVLAAALVSNYVLGAIPVWRALPGGERLGTSSTRVTEHDRIAQRALALVPARAVVSASNSLGGHLSERRRVLSFPVLADAAWVALDETQPGYADRIAPLEHAVAIARLRRDPRWRLVFQRDGILILERAGP